MATTRPRVHAVRVDLERRVAPPAPRHVRLEGRLRPRHPQVRLRRATDCARLRRLRLFRTGSVGLRRDAGER